MRGDLLLDKLRAVRRLERVIDEAKRSPANSYLGDFGCLWGKLQGFLVEESED